MASVRSFVAVECSAGVSSRAVALIERLKAAQAKVTWVHPERMHWTLKFLGDVDLTRTAKICQVVHEAVAPLAPFEMKVHGVGAFPNTVRPRTIWLGVKDGAELMVDLNRAVEDRLGQIGFSVEGRRFSPHLTIGRVRGQQNIEELGRLVAARADFDAGTQWVEEVAVYASHLEREGPVHEVLGAFELQG